MKKLIYKILNLIFVLFFFLIVHCTLNIENCSAQWMPLGIGAQNGTEGFVICLTVYNNELIVGGMFTLAGGVIVNNIAKWNGTSWSALGTGTSGPNATVNSLIVHNNQLIAVGTFTTAGGINVQNIAVWNGNSWSALQGGGFTATPLANVFSLCIYNGFLIAGGSFTTAGGNPASNIAAWDGTWHPLSTGMSGPVRALTVYNGQLIAGGDFSSPANGIAKYNGLSWSALGVGVNEQVMALLPAGNPSRLYVVGQFTVAGGNPSRRFARWDGNAWFQYNASGMDDDIYSLTLLNQNTIVAGGKFLTAGGLTVNHIASLPETGGSWSAFGTGTNNYVNTTIEYNGSLIIGGGFTQAGGITCNSIAQWATVGIRQISSNVPDGFSLSQNYPNPFNPSTKIRYELPKSGFVKLVVFDILGKEIETLVSEKQSVGTYETTFDATKYSSGVYYYKLSTGNFVETKKMLMIK